MADAIRQHEQHPQEFNRKYVDLGVTGLDGTPVYAEVVSLAASPAAAGLTLKSAPVNLSATGTIVAAVPSKRIKVYSYKLIVSAALSVNFRDGASTALEGPQAMIANGGVAEDSDPPTFLFGTTAGNSLDLVITGTGNVGGRVSYWDSDAT